MHVVSWQYTCSFAYLHVTGTQHFTFGRCTWCAHLAICGHKAQHAWTCMDEHCPRQNRMYPVQSINKQFWCMSEFIGQYIPRTLTTCGILSKTECNCPAALGARLPLGKSPSRAPIGSTRYHHPQNTACRASDERTATGLRSNLNRQSLRRHTWQASCQMCWVPEASVYSTSVVYSQHCALCLPCMHLTSTIALLLESASLGWCWYSVRCQQSLNALQRAFSQRFHLLPTQHNRW